MRNPVTKLTAAAAIIAVAGLAGIVMWTGTGSGIGLANVLAQVQQTTAYMFQTTMTVSGKDPTGQDTNENMEGTTLISQDDGMKTVMDSVDPNSGEAERMEMYMLLEEKVMIWLWPATKQYTHMELDDTLIEKMRQENYDPSSILKQILDCKYEILGRSTIDGVEVEGFETTDPNYQGGMDSQTNVKIWADVRTQLPVRLEADGEMDGIRIHAVIHNFQWNYPVDADTFKPVIRPDYTPLPGGDMKMLAMEEEGAIAGLKVCADLVGQYPEKLDFTTVTSLMSKLDNDDIPALDLSVEEDKGLSPEERVEKVKEQVKRIQEQMKKRKEQIKKREEQFDETMDKLRPVRGTVLFYMTLADEKKDPAYYGNVVTPRDANKVLLRWKVSDNQYRVIFGSLHVETISAEVLAELEKNLPK